LCAHLTAAGGRRRVLLGDLNSTTLFPAYRTLTQRLADAALAAASRNGGRTYPTWAPRPGWPRLLRIDHVLVDPSLYVESLRVLDLPGSDHAALLVDLLLSKS
jgi:endonuclease/exonuclease/phosphatase family metal-dependent hydrolase